jgi:hypothetical protein
MKAVPVTSVLPSGLAGDCLGKVILAEEISGNFSLLTKAEIRVSLVGEGPARRDREKKRCCYQPCGESSKV